MTSTQGQIKKTKEELQKLRMEFLAVGGDPATQAQIAERIKYHKRLLEQLGVKDNG